MTEFVHFVFCYFSYKTDYFEK